MEQRIIKVASSEDTAAIFGSYDVNVRAVEQTMGVSIRNRATDDGGDSIIVSGEDREQVNKGAAVIEYLADMIKYSQLSEQSVRYVIDMVDSGKARELAAVTGHPVYALMLGCEIGDAAKKLLYGEVGIDLVAGPSEILIVADHTANPVFVAADLLSQAEHGSGLEQAVMVTTSKELIDQVEKEFLRQKALLSRQETIEKVQNNGVFLIWTPDLEKACDLAGKYAPENLELQAENPEKFNDFSTCPSCPKVSTGNQHPPRKKFSRGL